MGSVFVGNMPFSVNEQGLSEFLTRKGCQVADVRIPQNDQGRPKGFAFVELADDQSLQKALELNGADCYGRQLRINAAESRQGGGGGGGGEGGSFGGGGGGGGFGGSGF